MKQALSLLEEAKVIYEKRVNAGGVPNIQKWEACQATIELWRQQVQPKSLSHILSIINMRTARIETAFVNILEEGRERKKQLEERKRNYRRK